MNSYFTKSDKVQNIIKGLELTKTLYVSSIITGEEGIGKKHLVRHLFPDTPMVSGNNQMQVEEGLESYDELIITDFEKLPNSEVLDFDGKRIIATANYVSNQHTIDNLFAFIYTMPSLKERPEDTEYLKKLFLSNAQKDLMLEDVSFDIDTLPVNLCKNTRSLKKSIYRHLIIHTMDKEDIKEATYGFLLEHMDGKNAYRDYIELYEKPLIEAGLERYGSQLKLSSALGINRNTLRKKIHEHSID